MYATTRYNFVRLKATHKISPLEELVGVNMYARTTRKDKHLKYRPISEMRNALKLSQ